MQLRSDYGIDLLSSRNLKAANFAVEDHNRRLNTNLTLYAVVRAARTSELGTLTYLALILNDKVFTTAVFTLTCGDIIETTGLDYLCEAAALAPLPPPPPGKGPQPVSLDLFELLQSVLNDYHLKTHANLELVEVIECQNLTRHFVDGSRHVKAEYLPYPFSVSDCNSEPANTLQLPFHYSINFLVFHHRSYPNVYSIEVCRKDNPKRTEYSEPVHLFEVSYCLDPIRPRIVPSIPPIIESHIKRAADFCVDEYNNKMGKKIKFVDCIQCLDFCDENDITKYHMTIQVNDDGFHKVFKVIVLEEYFNTECWSEKTSEFELLEFDFLYDTTPRPQAQLASPYVSPDWISTELMTKGWELKFMVEKKYYAQFE